jgi:hypothetical protein
MKYPLAVFLAIVIEVVLTLIPVKPASAQAESARSLLTSDKRLSALLTQPDRQMYLTRLFPIVYQASRVRLYSSATEFNRTGIVIGGASTVAAAMDAVAALWLLRWEKDEKGAYALLTSLHEFSIYLPRNEFEEKRFQSGMPFIKGYDDLPQEMQQSLSQGQSFPITALPASMYDAVRKMADTVNQADLQKGDDNPFPLSQLNQSKFQLKIYHPGKFAEFFVTLYLPDWGTMAWSFNDYQKGKSDSKSGVGAENQRLAYAPVKEEIPLKQARQKPQLQIKVNLQARGVTLSRVMRLLHQQYKFPFVADVALSTSERANVDLRNITLGEALDSLTETYKGAEWEYRKSGYIVMRDPANPARRVKPQTIAQVAP